MEVAKILEIDVSDVNNVQVLKTVNLDEIVNDNSATYFKVLNPQVYSLKTSEDVNSYLAAILQDNHKYVFDINLQNDVWNLIVDDIEFHVHKSGLICSNTTGKGFIIDSNLPRNNFKLYQEFLSVLSVEKQLAYLKSNLPKLGLPAEEFVVQEAVEGFKIEAFSNDGGGLNFELFYYSKTKELKLLNLLRGEGEIYYGGSEPYTLQEIKEEIKELQDYVLKYEKLEQQVRSIKLDL